MNARKKNTQRIKDPQKQTLQGIWNNKTNEERTKARMKQIIESGREVTTRTVLQKLKV